MYLYDIDLEEEVKSCNLPDATTTEMQFIAILIILLQNKKIIMFAYQQNLELELTK